jgi:AbrB family looped-hinge helix DNA binding protein
MRITTKGQVTIPLHIREKLEITPATEIDFIEEKGKVYIIKKPGRSKSGHRFTLEGIDEAVAEAEGRGYRSDVHR